MLTVSSGGQRNQGFILISTCFYLNLTLRKFQIDFFLQVDFFDEQ